MNREQREQIARSGYEQLSAGMHRHIEALNKLVETTNFDFDVASDVHPHLISGDTHAGREQLNRWQELYAALQDGPKSIATLRWTDGLVQGCYGFGAEPEYETKALWMHVYENVSADDIVFEKGGEIHLSRVVINKPCELFTRIGYKTGKSNQDNAVLYQQPDPNAELDFQNYYNDENFAEHEIIVFGDTVQEAGREVSSRVNRKLDNGASLAVLDYLIDKHRI